MRCVEARAVNDRRAHDRLLDGYLALEQRQPREDLTLEQLSDLAVVLLEGIVPLMSGPTAITMRAATAAVVAALRSWTVADASEAARAIPVEHRVRSLERQLARHDLASDTGLRLAIDLMALAPTSTFAFWRVRQHAAKLLELPDLRGSRLGRVAWSHAAETLAMADGDRPLAEELARTQLATGRAPIHEPMTLLRTTWLLLRLEWFGSALAQLAQFQGQRELSLEHASFAGALRAYGLAAIGPVDQAVATARRAMAGTGIAIHLGASVAIRALVRAGRLDEAQELLSSVPAPSQPASIGVTGFLIARGTLAAHVQRPTEALDDLATAREHLRRVGSRNPSAWPWLEPTIRAHVALGQIQPARRILDRARRYALAWGTPIVLAELHRACALLETEPDAARAARRAAVEALSNAEASLERTWTLQVLETNHGPAPAHRHAAVLATLTPRVREVTLLLAEGLRDREIAERLHISPRTVEHHVATALARTGSRNRVDLAVLIRAAKPDEISVPSAHRGEEPG
jgi:DNA-binding CsgD family transcriptional regulator